MCQIICETRQRWTYKAVTNVLLVVAIFSLACNLTYGGMSSRPRRLWSYRTQGTLGSAPRSRDRAALLLFQGISARNEVLPKYGGIRSVIEPSKRSHLRNAVRADLTIFRDSAHGVSYPPQPTLNLATYRQRLAAIRSSKRWSPCSPLSVRFHGFWYKTMTATSARHLRYIAFCLGRAKDLQCVAV